MEQLLAKYMKCGKLVKDSRTGAVYKLIADMDEGSASVKAVNQESWGRYMILAAWMRNWDKDPDFRARFTEDIKERRKELAGYEEDIKVCDVSPANQVWFVTADGRVKFIVNDLDVILVNGNRALVVYLDETHFAFGTGNATDICGGYFHIDQFAEICKKHSVKLELLSPEENTVTVYAGQLNSERYGDFVKCTDCGKLQLAGIGTESCSICKGNNLMWADEKHQECDAGMLVHQGYTVLYA